MKKRKKWPIIFIALSVFVISVMTFLFLQQKTSASTEKKQDVLRPSHYTQRVSLFKQLPIKQQSTVMLGDSMTLYNEWQEALEDTTVVNRGIAGDTTVGLLKRLDEVIDAKPQKIVLMIGINDLNMGRTPSDIMKNYTEIVTKIQQRTPETKLYIMSILPVNTTVFKRDTKNEDVQQLNAQIESLAKERHINFIDIYEKYVEENDLSKQFTSDGIHLNGEGYTIWVHALKERFSK